MKLSLKTLLCAALLCVPAAQAEIVWAKGVSADDGWYDANKSDDDNSDDMMCYAASAANLIKWWQESLTAVPSGTPTELSGIWGEYKKAAQNGATKGGVAGYAMAWWISGVYTPTTEEEAVRWGWPELTPSSDSELAAHSGYYYDQCSLTSTQVANFVGSYIINNNRIVHSYTLKGDSISGGLFQEKSFGAVLQDGYGISLGIKSDTDNSFGHAITLWGAEYNDEDGKLEKLWLTDSDDYYINYGGDRLFDANVTISEDGKVYIFTEKVTWVDADNPNKSWYTTQYEAGKGYYVDSVYLLNPKAFSVPVPEPATATLSLLALAGLAARRRRK